MLLTLALALQAGVPASLPGRVAVVSEPFEFDADTARNLCPEASARVTVRIGASAGPPIDPFAVLATAAPVVTLDTNSARPGDASVVVEAVGTARCIVLEGGTWLEWWSALRPYGKQSELGRALVRAHERGAVLVGIGPAGAHLAGACVLSRETLKRPSRDPHDATADVVLGGLGVTRGTCIDFPTDGRVDPERMLEAAFDNGFDRCVWLAGQCAWVQDEGAHTSSVFAATGTAYVFDASAARRSREVIEGVRVFRMRAGSVFDSSTATVQAHESSGLKRSVLDQKTATARSCFSASAGENVWLSGKALEIRGERHVLRLAFDTASDRVRGDHADDATDRARLDWIPVER